MFHRTRTLFPVLAAFVVWSGCQGTTTSPTVPSASSNAVPNPFTLALSGTVYGVQASGKVVLADATVEVVDARDDNGWGSAMTVRTDANGRYELHFSPRAPDYEARVRKAGFQDLIVHIGHVVPPMTQDFELTPANTMATMTVGQTIAATIGYQQPSRATAFGLI